MKVLLAVALVLGLLLFGCTAKPYGKGNSLNNDIDVRLAAIENDCANASGDGWSITKKERDFAPEYGPDGKKNIAHQIIRVCEYRHDGDITSYNYPLQECNDSNGYVGSSGSLNDMGRPSYGGTCMPKPSPFKCEDLFSTYTRGPDITSGGFPIKQGNINSPDYHRIYRTWFVEYRFNFLVVRAFGNTYLPEVFSGGSEVGENVGYSYLRMPFEITINVPSKVDSNGTVVTNPYDIIYRVDKLIVDNNDKIIEVGCTRIQ